MSRTNPWTKHRQSFWQGKVAQPGLPLWLRVTALAYGCHRRNGHAPMEPGDIALACSVVDARTGEVVKTPAPPRVSEAIRQAIDFGFLAEMSGTSCLVVPSWGIDGGLLGTPGEPCLHHTTSGKSGNRYRLPRTRLPEIAETTSGKSGSSPALTSGNARASKTLSVETSPTGKAAS